MAGVKPQTSGIGNNRSANWATTTAQHIYWFILLTASKASDDLSY